MAYPTTYPPYAGNYSPAPATYLPQPGYQPPQAFAPQPYGGRSDAPQAFAPQVGASSGISARLVTGREEAVASQIMPDGNIWLFADLAHGVIYTKQINPQTLAASFNEYRLQAAPVAAEPSASALAPQYATLEDFRALCAEVEKLKAAQAGAPANPASQPARGKAANAGGDSK